MWSYQAAEVADRFVDAATKQGGGVKKEGT